MSQRDRITLMAISLAVAAIGSWIVVVKPQRGRAAEISKQIISANAKADTASALASAGTAARAQYQRDYETVVRVGRAVPADEDVASFVYQVAASAKSAGVTFRSVSVEPPATSTTSPSPADGSSGGLGGGVTPVPMAMNFEGGFFAITRFLTMLEELASPGNGPKSLNGRLVSVDSVDIKPSERGFPIVEADVKTSAYTAPLADVNAVPVDPGSAAPGADPTSSPAASVSSAQTSPQAGAERETP